MQGNLQSKSLVRVERASMCLCLNTKEWNPLRPLAVIHAHLRIGHLEPAIPTATSKGDFRCHFLADSQITGGSKRLNPTTKWRGDRAAGSRQDSAALRVQTSQRIRLRAHLMVCCGRGLLMVHVTAIQRQRRNSQGARRAPSCKLLLGNQWKDCSWNTEYPMVPHRDRRAFCSTQGLCSIPLMLKQCCRLWERLL